MTRPLVPGLVLAAALAGCATPGAETGAAGTHVYVFVATDCPLANSYAPEINRIVSEYTPRGVRFTVVYVDLALTSMDVRRHAREYGLVAEVVLDAAHELADRMGVRVTPEVAVLRPDGAIAYRGRIDDRVIELGRKRLEPTRRDLRDALDAILAGRPVAEPSTPAVGCFIPR